MFSSFDFWEQTSNAGRRCDKLPKKMFLTAASVAEHDGSESLESFIFEHEAQAGYSGPQLADYPFPVSSIEGQRLHTMLQANRRLQDEVLGKLEVLQSMILKFKDTKALIKSSYGGHPSAIATDTDENLLVSLPIYEDKDSCKTKERQNTISVVEQFSAQRLRPSIYFQPFFQYKGSLPPPNKHCIENNVNAHLETVKNLYFSSKPLALHFNEEERLRKLVFAYMLSLDHDLARRLKSMNFPIGEYGRNIPAYSVEAFKFALEINQNAPVRWNRHHWQAISRILHNRTAEECRANFLTHSSPLINSSDKVSPAELQKLNRIIRQSPDPRDWTQIASDLGTGRMALNVFELYIRHIKKPATYKCAAWSSEDDALIIKLYDEIGPSITEIAHRLSGKCTVRQVIYRIRSLIPAPNKGKWTAEEDERLVYAVNVYKNTHPDDTPVGWREVSDFVQTRNDMQCRNRFEHSLNSSFDRSALDAEEAENLLGLISEIESTGTIEGVDVSGLMSKFTSRKKAKTDGKSITIPWSYISQHFFPTRKDSHLKNWYYNKRKKAKTAIE